MSETAISEIATPRVSGAPPPIAGTTIRIEKGRVDAAELAALIGVLFANPATASLEERNHGRTCNCCRSGPDRAYARR